MTAEISKERAAFLAKDFSLGFTEYCQLEAKTVKRGSFQGDTLICRARVVREGEQIIIAESEVSDISNGTETLAAEALVILMSVHKNKLTSKR